MAMNDEETALRQLQMALGASPDYRPALIALARIQLANPKRGDARATLQRIEKPSNDTLALEDRIGLASLYLALGDTARSRAATREALAVADERAVRRLPWDYTTANFIVLLRRFGLSNERPRIVQLATDLLDPVIRSQLESQSGR
jgi:Tfp pilus assembly protein PilF